VLTQDKSFKKYAMAYANDEALFFKEYAVIIPLRRVSLLMA
jgi:hypothetical protein